jgi:hypothetical protein
MDIKTSNSVQHPQHYNFAEGYEVIDVVEAWELTYNLGSAVKYITRAGKKDITKKVEDLKKAMFHLDRQIKLWEKEKEKEE